MLTNQRWRDRRDSYRPAGETIRTADYEVAPIAEDRVAKTFVETHHYSASYPAARFRFGLYHRDALVGVAVFSHPASDKVLTTVFPGEARASVELGRFVLLDQVPGNGETWFLARTFELLRTAGLRGVVSFSDPLPRTLADGTTVFGGHLGTIYQAHNAVYLGRGTPRTLRLLPDGTVFSARARQKVLGRRARLAVLRCHPRGARRIGRAGGDRRTRGLDHDVGRAAHAADAPPRQPQVRLGARPPCAPRAAGVAGLPETDRRMKNSSGLPMKEPATAARATLPGGNSR